MRCILFTSFLILISSAAPLGAQGTQTLPAGLETSAGNSSTAWPLGTVRGQTWHWVYDSHQFSARRPIFIQRIRMRPDEAVPSWPAARWIDVECVLASALNNYTRTSWQRSLAANLDPADRRTVYRGDLRISAGSHSPPGPAPWAIEIPLATPFVYDPTAGRDLVLELRTHGPLNPAVMAIDGRSSGAGLNGGNRYGDPRSSSASAWTFANDEFVPVIAIDYAPAAALEPAFEATPTEGLSPLAVSFLDHTYSAYPLTSWAWDFEDDGIVDSTLQNPVFTYTSSGLYDVRLTVDDGGRNGPRDIVRRAFIRADPPPRADFEATPRSAAAPALVSFHDLSANRPASWAWDFENDGVIDSSAQHPSHRYPTAGIYDVRLQVSNAAGSNTLVKPGFVRVLGAAGFPFQEDFEGGVLDPAFDTTDTSLPGEYRVGGTLAGVHPHAGQGMVTIATSASAGHSRHALDLHIDLTPVAGSPDLELRFFGLNHNDEADPGDRLLISDDGVRFHEILDLGTALLPAGAWHEIRIDLDREMAARALAYARDFIVRFQQEDNASFSGDDGFAFDEIRLAPVQTRADFSASPTGGPAPLAVRFSDTSQAHSSAPIVGWEWDFEDDGIVDSTLAAPLHTYASPGLYSVHLRVTDAAAGTSSVRRERLIRVGGVATFPLQDGFESGLLGPMWESWSELPAGRVIATGALGGQPYEGFYQALLDRDPAGPRCTNRLTLHIDLAGVPDAELSYAFRESGDEDDPEDGCFISADGIHWYLVQSHQGAASSWTRYLVDLGEAAAAAGIAFTSDFRIRFQQRDDFPVPSDGALIDAVLVKRRSGRTELFGTACGNPAGTPSIFPSGGPPNLGSALFTVHLGSAPPSAPGLLAAGTSRSSWSGIALPFDLAPLGAPGCFLNVSQEIALPQSTDAAGWSARTFPIPYQPGLLDARIHFQWLILDAATPHPALPLALSAGLSARLGLD